MSETVTFYPAVNGDDGHTNEFEQTLHTDPQTIFCGDPGGINRRAFVRFPGVTIPPGSTILTAYLRLTGASNQTAIGDIGVGFAAFDSPAAPTSYAEYAALTVDTWVMWTTAGCVDGTVYETPEIKTLLQAIIDRAGWASGNAVVVRLYRDTGYNGYMDFSAYDFDGGSEKPELYVEYALPPATKVIPRTPITLLILTMDYCSLTFGVAPCTATGSGDAKCYNTYPTCKAKAAYAVTTKQYRFSSADAPLPFGTGERPYLGRVKYLPTEIKDSLTVTGRVTADLYDEPDLDVGIDPYVTGRTTVQGTYWKKWLTRNSNFKGRIAEYYQGFYGDLEATYDLRFVGRIDNIQMNKGAIRLECVDLLKDLEKVEIPAKLDLKLAIDITIDQVQMTLTGNDMATLTAPGYLKIGEEVIYYAAIDTATGIASTLTRGHMRTTAAVHETNDKVQLCKYYAPANPFVHMQSILADAGIVAGYIDSAAFSDAEDVPGGDLDMEALISEPTKAKELYFELVNLLGCKTWVGEDNKITIARELPNRPGRTYTALSDSDNIVNESTDVDLNQKSRISRCPIYWDPVPLEDIEKNSTYNRLSMPVDAEAESAKEYGEIAEKKIMCRWLNSTLAEEGLLEDYVAALGTRIVALHRDPVPLLSMDVEIKDAALLTGDYAKITTDELLDSAGADLVAQPFQIVKRERKSEGLISLKAQRIIQKRYLVIYPAPAAGEISWSNGSVALTWTNGSVALTWPTEGDLPTWATATAAQKEYGAISDADGLMSDGDFGARIW